MSVDTIITIALKAIDKILELVATLGSNLSEEDLAKLKLGIIEGVNKRAAAIKAQEDREWAIVNGGD